MTTPSGNRSAQINATASSERAAKKAYDEAIVAVNGCDPLTVGYDECQGRLQRAAKLLLKAREAHRLALVGANAPPVED